MTDAWIEKCITEISGYTRTHLSRFRYEHSVRVAVFAEELAQHYGCSHRQQRLCYLAGISHDACKEIPIASLLRIVQQDGQRVSAEERNNAELLHGRAAAVFLQTRYGIHKKSLVRAVRCHTSASEKCDMLGKILYIDDKIAQYIADIVFASRYPERYGLAELKDMITYGGSPRASINLAKAGRAYAFIKHRGYVIPEDVRAVAHDVMRHRIGLSYEAEASNISSEEIVSKIINKVEVP